MDNEALINGYFEDSLSASEKEEFDRLMKTDPEFLADFEFQRELQLSLKKDERRQIKSLFSQLDTETDIDDESNRDDVEKFGTVERDFEYQNGSAGPTVSRGQFQDDTRDMMADEKQLPESTGEAVGTIGEKQGTPTRNDIKVFSIRPWLIAASIILLIGIGSWLIFFNSPDMSTEQLYAANFAPYENVVHPIERGEKLEDLKTKAFLAYEDGDYPLALELFKELQAQHADPYIDFYKAIILMQLNQHEEAIPLLKGYIENDGQLKDRATWYLALAHLKIGDTSEVRAVLEKLVQMGTFKTKDAEKLLKSLS